MPNLKQLTCEIEHGLTKKVYPEYGTTYGDGLVETFVCVPPQPEPLAIHLSSKGYIAPGLAMFVYMDGVYQCNRNRFNLSFPDGKTDSKYTDVDFRVRQKEEKTKDGSYVGREWRFDNFRICKFPIITFVEDVADMEIKWMMRTWKQLRLISNTLVRSKSWS